MNRAQKTALFLGAAGAGAWLATRPRANFSFTGKVVLVTGGSRGLGLVLARELTKNRAKVAICARDPDELNGAAADLISYGSPPFTVPCDVSDAGQVRDMIDQIRSHWGPPDVVINNASTITVGPVSRMTRRDYEEALNITFWGAYNVIEACVPEMRARRSGRIVNISSIGGQVSIPHLVPYCVAKYALVGYSRGLRAELANNGIVVTTVCPGLMRTGSPRHGSFKGQHDAEYAWFKISDSLPFLTISAEHAARSVLQACRSGRAEIVLSLPAKFGVTLQGLCPELTAALVSLANRMLPRPGDAGTEAHAGEESEPNHPMITALTNKAARKNNEMIPV